VNFILNKVRSWKGWLSPILSFFSLRFRDDEILAVTVRFIKSSPFENVLKILKGVPILFADNIDGSKIVNKQCPVK
jgi:hypothetical protein